MTASADPTARLGPAGGNDSTDQFVRFVAWANVYCLAVFMAQIGGVMLLDLPGPVAAFSGAAGGGGWLLLALYPAAVLAALVRVRMTPLHGLREDCDRLSAANGFIVRAAFFAVLYVGLVDAVISFMRIEGLMAPIIGEELDNALGRPLFRGPWVHMPLILAGAVTAVFARTPGFTWLALLIVLAELLIVLSRFVFSYEQSFMGDLVRFWYGSLFLFASAYTFLDEGHVRVDVLYAGMSTATKGAVNALGCLALGVVMCWLILALGMGGPNSTVMAPMLNFMIGSNTTGMFVKYLMAGFLGVYAVTMLIQFCANMLDAVADWRGHPGHRDREPVAAA